MYSPTRPAHVVGRTDDPTVLGHSDRSLPRPQLVKHNVPGFDEQVTVQGLAECLVTPVLRSTWHDAQVRENRERLEVSMTYELAPFND